MSVREEDIAIIGMAGRFPGAESVSALWSNLTQGVESVRAFTDDELRAAGVNPAIVNEKDYVNAGAPLEDADKFDAQFFGYNPREAQLMDPQQRIFLECVHNALEDAACSPPKSTELISVFGGVARNTYFMQHAQTYVDLLKSGGTYEALLGSDKDYVATRAAFKLNLHGPSFTVQSACSSSAVATHVACQALLNDDCDIAVVGGARVQVPLTAGYRWIEGGIPSRTGRVRPFDAQADGCIYGSGAAAIVLKRATDAVADNDRIYALIKGTAINNDGVDKAGFTAPSVSGQTEVIKLALSVADVDPASVSYVEAHGTATNLGDPIEVQALTKAYREQTDRRGYCAIGSLKSNIGHLDAGAGVAGIVKAALMLHHQKLVPSLNYDSPNPQIDFDASPFFVSRQCSDWRPADGPLRAGVSSFGLGGTNFHGILEQAPAVQQRSVAKPPRFVLPYSAKSPAALGQRLADAKAFLLDSPQTPLDEIAHTLHSGRTDFVSRACVVGQDRAELLAQLDQPPAPVTAIDHVAGLAFMFSGQGAQFPAMGRDLYRELPEFRAEADHCAAILNPLLGLNLIELVFDADPSDQAAANKLADTRITQPALFMLEFSLARQLLQWGLQPTAMIGHSLGEYVAACLAGVFSLEDALRTVARRGQIMAAAEPGSMLALPLALEQLDEITGPQISLASVNGPNACVVAGATEVVQALAQRLQSDGIEGAMLKTSHAFHSHLMEPVLAEFRAHFEQIQLREPSLPFVSNVTGNWITPAEATDPDYWVRHIRQPVRFADGIATLTQDQGLALLEVGPGHTLATLARQSVAPSTSVVIPSMRHVRQSDVNDVTMAYRALGDLWAGGYPLQWDRLYDFAATPRAHLPGYPFERTRYWLEPVESASTATQSITESTTETAPAAGVEPQSSQAANAPAQSRSDYIIQCLRADLFELSGIAPEQLDLDATFIELGFDSLFLMRAASTFQSTFEVEIGFRRLMEDTPSLSTLAQYLDEVLEPTAFAEQLRPAETSQQDQPAAGSIEAQLAAMRVQIEQLSGALSGTAAPAKAIAASPPAKAPARPAGTADKVARTGPWKPIATGSTELSASQRDKIAELTRESAAKMPGSMQFAERQRVHYADARAVIGFRRHWKDLCYTVVVKRSKGARVWDIDGNEYVDVMTGLGTSLFGHSPEFLLEAVREQLEIGVEIGTQTELAGEVAKMACQLTGMDRAAFCNTGSEAVLTAIRLARTVTGRDQLVMFTGSYHGLFDEVLAARMGGGKSVPIAPGIPPWAVNGINVLEYGSAAALEFLRDNHRKLAAVLVEPVQSRHPGLQPVEFLRELRSLTSELGITLIFDEIITGFRTHPRGAQGAFGIQADIGAYGKAIANGFPMSIVAGKRRFMDAIDGGGWSYGDDSYPQATTTWFGGTFVRHPLALAAARAVMSELVAQGEQLQADLGRRTSAMVAEINQYYAARGAPIRLDSFTSVFNLEFTAERDFAPMLFWQLRQEGLHIGESRPAFISTAHSDADIAVIVQAFKTSLDKLQHAGFFVDQSVQTESQRLVPLTAAQKEIWLGCQMGLASSAFNLSNALTFTGDLDPARMEAAFTGLLQANESLRAGVDADGEHLVIWAEPTPDFDYQDWSDQTTAESDRKFAELVATEVATPFDFAAGSLLRGRLIRLTPTRHRLLVTAHHIVCDGWSTGLIMRELGERYRQGASAPAKPKQFSDYLDYVEQRRSSGATAQSRAYWLDQLAGFRAEVELPPDRPRGGQRSFNAKRESLTLDGASVTALKDLAAGRNTTLFTALLTAYYVLLHRLTGVEDIVTGITVAGQPYANMPGLIGHCVHMLPLRAQIDGDRSFDEHLQQLKVKTLSAFEHHDVSYGELLPELKLDRHPARPPLITTNFNIDPSAQDIDFGELGVEVQFNPRSFEIFDQFFNVVQKPDGTVVECTYNADLFDPETVRYRLGLFQRLINELVLNSGRAIDSLPLVEHSEFLARTSSQASFDRIPLNGWELIRRYSQQHASDEALACADDVLSHSALMERTGKVASWLREAGVQPGDVVGVYLQRSIDLVTVLLATWRLGAAYLPLDPMFPKDRIAFMLDDAAVKVTVTQSQLEAAINDVADRLLLIDSGKSAWDRLTPIAEQPPVGPDAIAYLIYTSGSTGTPKGVEVKHQGVVNLLQSMQQELELGPRDVFVAITTVSFDISVLELFLPLLTGARLVVAQAEESVDVDRLIGLLDRVGATAMQATPSTWRMLLDAGWNGASSFKAYSGGEPLAQDLCDALLARCQRLWNLYGPTETTIWSTCARLTPGAQVNIGAPIANTSVYILNHAMQPQPLGAVGEIYIGGDGVAKGYLNRDQLNRERFVSDPFEPDAVIYRTGDLGRWDRHGRIQHLGRIDDQVKIRGYRIELGEIEIRLRQSELVEDAVVNVAELADGDQRLIAYVTSANGAEPDSDAIRRALAGYLPAYMIPQHVVTIPAIPRTPNGKVDRRALPDLQLDAGSSTRAYRQPETEVEKTVAEIWARLIGVSKVGLDDDFFALGGHSLLAVKAARECTAIAGQKLNVALIFETPTLGDFTAAIARLRSDSDAGRDKLII